MIAEKLNGAIKLPLEELEDRIKLRINPEFSEYNTVVSPRELRQVTSVCVMHQNLLTSLISNIPLREDVTILPYKNLSVSIALAEPRTFQIGQRFVLKDKIFELMTQMPQKIFDGFCLSGVSTAPPMQLYGLDSHSRKATAFYVPPIIEYHSSRPVLLDGIHRSYICKGTGAPINAVQIFNVSVSLPFSPLYWDNCALSDEKPPKPNRYENLRTILFRDLTYVGIDG